MAPTPSAPAPQPSEKRGPRLLTVKSARYLTKNMIRVTFIGGGLKDFPKGREGANCKLIFPEGMGSKAEFLSHFEEGPPKKGTFPVRTYTIRHYREEAQELDIDFVAHGDEGPATRWAQAAKPGDYLMLMGPGPVKMSLFYARYYIVAADMSALPVAAAALEAMPRDAKGIAIFEVMSEDDKQAIDIPEGFDVRWLINPDPHKPSTAQLDLLKSISWPDGPIQTCIAGEHSVIKGFREFLLKEKSLPAKDTYISGYWKIGLVEDEHQKMKREDAAAA
ncbi:siderophore-interacting protein [Pseudovibrio exalbescens]|uniref:siderophore-interacting protein n=1 Tax=Pseudovibrio exalbescens TaxID=197461 RepID=UPI002365969E|nr:siderophore-interacting protein [Pseudovibrio exalbescens]MDD7910787.1 siderophore-interacting protein [Pseudovibrio exalbescens]